MAENRDLISGVGELLSQRARINPEMEALVDLPEGCRLSFRELDDLANRIANALADRIGPGDRIAVLALNGHWYEAIVFAAARLGAILVPLNWRLAALELVFQIEDSEPNLLLFDSNDEVLAKKVAELLPGQEWLRLDDGRRGETTLAGLTEKAGSEWKRRPIRGEDGWLILYTSGTTGRPKGALHTHRSSLAWCQSALASLEVRNGDRQLLVAPMFHIAGICLILNAVHRGYTLVVTGGFDAGEVWRLFEAESITCMFAVPTMINMMREHPDRGKHSHAALRWIMCGAAPVPVALIDAFAVLDIDIHQVYGSTETHGGIAILPPSYAHSRKGSTGMACFGVELRVVDGEGHECGPGVKGEIITRGPHVFAEYWKLPEETANSFSDGWFRLGDIGDMDEDGFLTIRDRSKDMIISGGENVYPAEIEDVLLRSANVLEAAVIGQPDDRWGETPLAIVVARDCAKPTEEAQSAELAALCGEILSRYKQPKRYVYVDELPRNAAGKVMKHVLRGRYCGK